MLAVSNEYSQAIVADVRDMPYRITLAGSIVLEQTQVPKMTLSESVSGNNGLSIGTANSAALTLTLRDPLLTNYDGMLVEPESGLVLPDGTTEWVPLGKFWVTKTTTSNDYKTVSLTCADGMYHLSREYVSELEYPTSIQAVVAELVAKSGVDFVEPASYPDLIVRRKPEGLSLRNAFGYVAGCCGCNARFNRTGQLEFVWYQDTGITVERNTQYMDGMTKLHDKPLEVTFEVTGEVEKYEVTIVSDDNGTVTPTPSRNVLEGDTVTLAVRPSRGYQLAIITAVTASGAAVRLTEDAEGSGYTFVQPDSNVTVTASFKENTDGPFKVRLRSAGSGYAYLSNSGNAEGNDYFHSGETVKLYVWPEAGKVVDTFTTTPANLGITETGSVSSELHGEGVVYSFTMPESDVSVTIRYREDATYLINRVVDDPGFPVSPGYILVTNKTTGEYTYREGDVITVSFSAEAGFEFDRYEGNIEMTQMSATDFMFIMPAEDVSFTAYFEQQSDPSKIGLYSFLEHPSKAVPPTEKPFWAVFYKYSRYVGANAKYYLVWFDSWSESYGTIKMKGYYYCQGANNGRSAHRWDDSTWSGSGDSGSTLSWDASLSRNDEDYCLIATNAHLYRNYTLVFQKCDTAIGIAQTDWLVDGVDVREEGALTKYACPDTYSTPLPAANWIMTYGLQVYKDSEDSLLGYEIILSGSGQRAIFFNDVSVSKVEGILSNANTYRLDFSGVTVVPLYTDGTFGSLVKEITEPCYIIVIDPDYYSSSNAGLSSSGRYCGLAGSNMTIRGGGMVFHNNCTIVCDCVSAVSTFSLRAAARAITADPVTLTYTNPMIYEKMVSAIQTAVQGLTYTPAKVKHRGNPAFQAGDIVTVPDGNGDYHTVLIMQQTMTFGGGMNSEITCPGQTAETANFSSSSPLTTQIKQEVNQSYASLEQKLSSENALAFSAIFKSLTVAQQGLQTQLDNMSDDLYNAQDGLVGIKDRLLLAEQNISNLDSRADVLEENYSYLQKDLADVQAAVSNLETAVGEAQADIEAINAALDTLTATVDTLAADIDALELRVTELEARVAALEDDNDLGNLKRELAATDQQIAHCAEIFMLEVMVNGTEISAVVLPYNISELHTTRETLRAQIAELEAEANE